MNLVDFTSNIPLPCLHKCLSIMLRLVICPLESITTRTPQN